VKDGAIEVNVQMNRSDRTRDRVSVIIGKEYLGDSGHNITQRRRGSAGSSQAKTKKEVVRKRRFKTFGRKKKKNNRSAGLGLRTSLGRLASIVRDWYQGW
jgi:hypothetical protein